MKEIDDSKPEAGNRVDHLLLRHLFERVSEEDRYVVVLPHNAAEFLYILAIVNTILGLLILLLILHHLCNGRRQQWRKEHKRRFVHGRQYRNRYRNRYKRKHTAIQNRKRRTLHWLAATQPREFEIQEPADQRCTGIQVRRRNSPDSWGTVWDETSIASTPAYENPRDRATDGFTHGEQY